MATSCEGNNWFWDYFTSVNNIAKCDICYALIQITEVPKDKIMRHIVTEHRDNYQRIVSSGNSQKDLELQLYIIQNNDITCNFCNSMFYATNNSYSLINHLERKHKIQKDIAAAICDWLRKHYFDEIDTDMKRRCTSCNETILNKPLLLMSHLSKAHEFDVPLKSKSIMGFFISKNWVWEYFTCRKNVAKCSVCSKNYVPQCNLSIIINHIKMEHGNMFDVLENSQGNKNWPYSITENSLVICDICDKNYDIIFASVHMKTHLVKGHKLEEDIARKLCNWLLEYFHKSNLQSSKCSICENMFQTSNSFYLMIHLKEAHQVRVPPEIIPAGLSSELSSLLNSDRCAENNAPSNSCNQPPRNVDQSSDRVNLYDEIDNSSEIKTTRYAQDIVTSKYQQPTRSFDQSSDCDNFSDQIDESSEIRTTRLLSSSSRILNFDNNSEDFAASYSYQQPTYSRY